MYRIPLENEQITKALTTPYAPVDFTDEEKARVRANIGAEDSGRFSNPNLLDNWWWGKGVINQRGQTTYSNSGFCIDRWIKGSHGVLTLNPFVLTFAGGSDFNSSYIYQYIDKDIITPNTNYTFSMIVNGELVTVTRPFRESSGTNKTNVGDFQIWFNTSANYKYVAIYFNTYPKAYTITAVKLEEGSVSTLLNDLSRFNSALELLKCQNHCVVLKGNSRMVAMGFVNGAFMRSYPLLYNELKPTAAEMIGSFSVYTTGLPVINVTAVTVSNVGTLDLTLAQSAPSNYSLGGLRPSDDNSMIILHDSFGG